MLEAGGDYFLALKDNQATLADIAADKLDARPADWTSEIETGHGRIEYRELRACAFDLDVALFPGARQLVSITRHHRAKSSDGDYKGETRHFITSIAQGEATLPRLAEIARQHWSVENKNHWRKDATAWQEDRSARRKPRGAKNLALLRNALLAIIEPSGRGGRSLNQTFIHYDKHPTAAIHLILKARPHDP